MKKHLFTIFMVLLLLVSCSNDSTSNVSISEKDLIGTWKLSELYSRNTQLIITTKQGISATVNTKITTKNYNNPVTTFEANPKKVYDNGSFVMVSEFSVPNRENFTDEKKIVADPSIKSDWTLINNNTLNFSLLNSVIKGTINAQIIDFNEKTLKLKAVLSEDYDTNELKKRGIEVSNAKIKGELYLSYTK